MVQDMEPRRDGTKGVLPNQAMGLSMDPVDLQVPIALGVTASSEGPALPWATDFNLFPKPVSPWASADHD
jgi:hypothetical protein